MQSLASSLDASHQEEILMLWDDYENAVSTEAKLAKAFDKLETILQHTQGQNPPDFNYGFNLEYGKTYTDSDPVTAAIRKLLDKETEKLAKM
jgi:putative hydrolase of HD superfamily